MTRSRDRRRAPGLQPKVVGLKMYAAGFALVVGVLTLIAGDPLRLQARGAPPTMVDPALDVYALTTGLIEPTGMVFLGDYDMFVTEKRTGQVKRVVEGVVTDTVLDLPVNFASERGLLGIALHPEFPANPGVYLFWTASTTGTDSSVLASVATLGNRVDRYVWDGTTLSFEHNLIELRAFQMDGAQPLRGNHNGGVIRFGPDGKLYIYVGDTGRRGQTQNLLEGPFGPGKPDDQFGGPEPDNAHLTGVILRLNDDGTAPEDNPYFQAGAEIGGEVGANIQKLFAFGIRNGFGLAFDPFSGNLWLEENADDAFTELNLVDPGFNGGWIQVMGPLERIAEFKEIEVMSGSLQQTRYPPTRIADTPEEAFKRLIAPEFYADPKFSWKYEVAPAGIGFMESAALGDEYYGDLFVGAGTPRPFGGYLFRFKLTDDRREVMVLDPLLEDRVADNIEKFDPTESESLLFGENFGITTDIKTGPNGNLFVVSLSNGAIYEIFRAGDGKKPQMAADRRSRR